MSSSFKKHGTGRFPIPLPIGTNLVNQFRFGYVGATANQHGTTGDPADVAALQLTGVFTNLDDDQRSLPGIGLGGVGTGLIGVGSAGNDYQASYQPMWDISNNTARIRGRHTLNFGANYRKWSLQRDLANDFLGKHHVQRFFHGQPDQRPRDCGHAARLLSSATVFQPAGFSVGDQAGNPRQFNFFYLAPYIQDDWKVNSRLTLNLGLRWDFRTVPNESNDRMLWRDLSNPRGGLLFADQTLQEKGIAGDGSYYKNANRRNPDDASKNVFAPRFGLAFRPFSRRQDRGARRLWCLLRFCRRTRDRWRRRHLSLREPRKLSPKLWARPICGQRTSCFPILPARAAATPAANTFLAVSMSPDTAQPLRAAVVSRNSARPGR